MKIAITTILAMLAFSGAALADESCLTDPDRYAGTCDKLGNNGSHDPRLIDTQIQQVLFAE